MAKKENDLIKKQNFREDENQEEKAIVLYPEDKEHIIDFSKLGEECSDKEMENVAKTVVAMLSICPIFEDENQAVLVQNGILISVDIENIEKTCSKCPRTNISKTFETSTECQKYYHAMAKKIGFKKVKCYSQFRNKIVWGYHPEVIKMYYPNIKETIN